MGHRHRVRRRIVGGLKERRLGRYLHSGRLTLCHPHIQTDGLPPGARVGTIPCALPLQGSKCLVQHVVSGGVGFNESDAER